MVGARQKPFNKKSLRKRTAGRFAHAVVAAAAGQRGRCFPARLHPPKENELTKNSCSTGQIIEEGVSFQYVDRACAGRWGDSSSETASAADAVTFQLAKEAAKPRTVCCKAATGALGATDVWCATFPAVASATALVSNRSNVSALVPVAAVPSPASHAATHSATPSASVWSDTVLLRAGKSSRVVSHATRTAIFTLASSGSSLLEGRAATSARRAVSLPRSGSTAVTRRAFSSFCASGAAVGNSRVSSSVCNAGTAVATAATSRHSTSACVGGAGAGTFKECAFPPVRFTGIAVRRSNFAVATAASTSRSSARPACVAAKFPQNTAVGAAVGRSILPASPVGTPRVRRFAAAEKYTLPAQCSSNLFAEGKVNGSSAKGISFSHAGAPVGCTSKAASVRRSCSSLNPVWLLFSFVVSYILFVQGNSAATAAGTYVVTPGLEHSSANVHSAVTAARPSVSYDADLAAAGNADGAASLFHKTIADGSSRPSASDSVGHAAASCALLGGQECASTPSILSYSLLQPDPLQLLRTTPRDAAPLVAASHLAAAASRLTGTRLQRGASARERSTVADDGAAPEARGAAIGGTANSAADVELGSTQQTTEKADPGGLTSAGGRGGCSADAGKEQGLTGLLSDAEIFAAAARRLQGFGSFFASSPSLSSPKAPAGVVSGAHSTKKRRGYHGASPSPGASGISAPLSPGLPGPGHLSPVASSAGAEGGSAALLSPSLGEEEAQHQRWGLGSSSSSSQVAISSNGLVCEDDARVEAFGAKCRLIARSLGGRLGCEKKLIEIAPDGQLPPNIPAFSRVADACPATCGLCEECAPGCALWFLGNTLCDEACNNARCQFDGGDCWSADCVVSEWSPWSACSVSCGGPGVEMRKREIKSKPKQGGLACPKLEDTRMGCNAEVKCPNNCIISEWGEWSSCSTTCGEGQSRRRRTILQQPDAEGDFQSSPQQQQGIRKKEQQQQFQQ